MLSFFPCKYTSFLILPIPSHLNLCNYSWSQDETSYFKRSTVLTIFKNQSKKISTSPLLKRCCTGMSSFSNQCGNSGFYSFNLGSFICCHENTRCSRSRCGGVAQLIERRPTSYAPEGCRFDSASGNVPGLWARFPVGGVQQAASWCFSTLMFLWLFPPP